MRHGRGRTNRANIIRPPDRQLVEEVIAPSSPHRQPPPLQALVLKPSATRGRRVSLEDAGSRAPLSPRCSAFSPPPNRGREPSWLGHNVQGLPAFQADRLIRPPLTSAEHLEVVYWHLQVTRGRPRPPSMRPRLGFLVTIIRASRRRPRSRPSTDRTCSDHPIGEPTRWHGHERLIGGHHSTSGRSWKATIGGLRSTTVSATRARRRSTCSSQGRPIAWNPIGSPSAV